MLLVAMLFAEDVAKPAEPPAMGPFNNPIFFMVMIGLFMFTMLWLPQRRQKREMEAMLANLKEGADVVTASGIMGTVEKVFAGEDKLLIKSEGTKLKITRSSVVRVGAPEATKS